ncbi:MAG: DUF305 domain-containing protein [Gemmatimonadota bacterium]|nr:DUF305 domain-containing protein [Gemmatimonadota bacterium]MDH3427338.1 DUF305 domain-containing protein [Gemmatimonadota bacterium]
MKRSLAIFAVTAAACGPALSTAPPSGPGAASDVAGQAAIADSVRTSYTAADVDFMSGMIHHHAQALVMARMAPTHGASPPMRILTARIINAQNDEIALMRRWLTDRNLPAPDPESDGHMMHMPGMLTAGQLAALDAARGEEFDRLFLQFMIQHHQGAITMVEELFAIRGAAQDDSVFKLASDIGADQESEITRMRTMLRDILLGDGGS